MYAMLLTPALSATVAQGPELQCALKVKDDLS